MKKNIFIPSIHILVLFIFTLFGCSFEQRTINTSITIPTKAIQRAVNFDNDSEHYLEYTLSGALEKSEKLPITSQQLEEEDISFEINEIPLEQKLNINIEIVEYKSSQDSEELARVVLLRGNTEKILTSENEEIEVKLEVVEIPIIPPTTSEIEFSVTLLGFVETNPDATYYLEYELMANDEAEEITPIMDKIEIDQEQISTENLIPFTVKDVPLDKQILSIVNIKEYLTDEKGTPICNIVYEGDATETFSSENTSISISLLRSNVDINISFSTSDLRSAGNYDSSLVQYLEYTVTTPEDMEDIFGKVEISSELIASFTPVDVEIKDIPVGNSISFVVSITEYPNSEDSEESRELLRGVTRKVFSTNDLNVTLEYEKKYTPPVEPGEPEQPEEPVEPGEPEDLDLVLEDITTNTNFNVGDLILTNNNVIRYNENNNFVQYANFAAQAVAVIFRATEGTNEALGVGVKQTYCNWVKDSSSTGYSTNFGDKLSFTKNGNTYSGFIDGSNSWSFVCEKDDTAETNITEYTVFNFAEKYPQVYYTFNGSNLEDNINEPNYLQSTNFESNWYIPTCAECEDIYQNKAIVNSVLNALNANDANTKTDKYPTFYNPSVHLIYNEWYWTSNVSTSGEAYFFGFGDKQSYSINQVQSADDTFYVLAIRKF